MFEKLQPLALSAVLFLGAGAGHSLAAMSEWAVSEGGRMRLVALPPEGNGHIRAGLQIEPKPGWITYWREPGNSGIPPQIAALPGGSVALKSIFYPVPKHIEAGAASDFGYDQPVTLPLDFALVQPGTAAQIDVQAFIGLCKNICIPFQATFSLPLPSSTNRSSPEETQILDAARATLPEKPGADFNVDRFSLSTDTRRLRLDLTLPKDAGNPEIIVTGPGGYVFTRQENARPGGEQFFVEVVIPGLPKNYSPAGKQWGLLVKTRDRAMETTLAFD